jgi:hypothetical protein
MEYVVGEAVAGASKNETVTEFTTVVVPRTLRLPVTRSREPSASPIAIGVAPLISRKLAPSPSPFPDEPFTYAITRTLLVSADGVIVTDRPVTAVKVVEVLLSVLVLTACTTFDPIPIARNATVLSRTYVFMSVEVSTSPNDHVFGVVKLTSAP